MVESNARLEYYDWFYGLEIPSFFIQINQNAPFSTFI